MNLMRMLRRLPVWIRYGIPAGAVVLMLLLSVVIPVRRLTRLQMLPTTVVVKHGPHEVFVERLPTIVVGQKATIRFHVLREGRLADLEEEGRLLHVIIASEDLQDIFHTIDPAEEGHGIYSVDHVFQRAGRYRIWTEVDNTNAAQRHDAHADLLAYADVTVRGPTPPQGTQETLVRSTEAIVRGYQIRLHLPSLTAGSPLTIRAEIRDAQGHAVPLVRAEPFLFVLVGEQFSFFRHGHGMTLPDGSAGLETVFPHPGHYAFWIQLFSTEGAFDVPFLLTVGPSEKSPIPRKN